jgi:hypothetical protein
VLDTKARHKPLSLYSWGVSFAGSSGERWKPCQKQTKESTLHTRSTTITTVGTMHILTTIRIQSFNETLEQTQFSIHYSLAKEISTTSRKIILLTYPCWKMRRWWDYPTSLLVAVQRLMKRQKETGSDPLYFLHVRTRTTSIPCVAIRFTCYYSHWHQSSCMIPPCHIFHDGVKVLSPASGKSSAPKM